MKSTDRRQEWLEVIVIGALHFHGALYFFFFTFFGVALDEWGRGPEIGSTQ